MGVSGESLFVFTGHGEDEACLGGKEGGPVLLGWETGPLGASSSRRCALAGVKGKGWEGEQDWELGEEQEWYWEWGQEGEEEGEEEGSSGWWMAGLGIFFPFCCWGIP